MLYHVSLRLAQGGTYILERTKGKHCQADVDAVTAI